MSRWTVGDVMTTEVTTVAEDTPFQEIVDLLEAHRISGLPVVDSWSRVVGVVSESDLLAKLEFADEPRRSRRFAPRRVRTAWEKAGGEAARDVMTDRPVTVMAHASVAAAARLMTSAGVKRLPVTNLAGRLVGIVTRSDLLKVFLRPDAAQSPARLP